MFCPNCGAQNPDNATACSNCGFNLKQQGTAAPKFKGTMLMMNSPIAGSTPATQGSQPPPGSSPLDPAEQSGRRQMKGTIVGIAPPAPGAAPAPITPNPSTMPSGGSFAPPGGVGSVNPMGSTFADDKPLAGFPPPTPGYGGGAPFGSAPQAPPLEVPSYQPPGAGYGAPPADQGYGTPAPDQGYGAAPGNQGYGTPPGNQGYGTPPGDQGYGAPPGNQGYGAPPGNQTYGAPPGGAPGYGPTPGYGPGSDPSTGGGYGAPVQTPGAIVGPAFGLPSDAGAMVPAGGPAMTASGAPGTVRNPVMVLVLSMCTFGLYGLYTLYSIENEIHALLGDGQKASILWFLFPLVPLLAMPKLMAQARQRAGTPTQGEGNLLAYLFLGIYLIPSDANQVWQQLGARPAS